MDLWACRRKGCRKELVSVLSRVTSVYWQAVRSRSDFSTTGANFRSFALKEVRLILAVLLRRFDLTIVPDQKIQYRHHSVLYIASGEYLVGVRKRVA